MKLVVLCRKKNDKHFFWGWESKAISSCTKNFTSATTAFFNFSKEEKSTTQSHSLSIKQTDKQVDIKWGVHEGVVERAMEQSFLFFLISFYFLLVSESSRDRKLSQSWRPVRLTKYNMWAYYTTFADSAGWEFNFANCELGLT